MTLRLGLKIYLPHYFQLKISLFIDDDFEGNSEIFDEV